VALGRQAGLKREIRIRLGSKIRTVDITMRCGGEKEDQVPKKRTSEDTEQKME
jgi:hypothetical protein